eukprot:1187384-Prorocentrum_minimum.AAC.2
MIRAKTVSHTECDAECCADSGPGQQEVHRGAPRGHLQRSAAAAGRAGVLSGGKRKGGGRGGGRDGIEPPSKKQVRTAGNQSQEGREDIHTLTSGDQTQGTNRNQAANQRGPVCRRESTHSVTSSGGGEGKGGKKKGKNSGKGGGAIVVKQRIDNLPVFHRLEFCEALIK